MGFFSTEMNIGEGCYWMCQAPIGSGFVTEGAVGNKVFDFSKSFLRKSCSLRGLGRHVKCRLSLSHAVLLRIIFSSTKRTRKLGRQFVKEWEVV